MSGHDFIIYFCIAGIYFLTARISYLFGFRAGIDLTIQAAREIVNEQKEQNRPEGEP